MKKFVPISSSLVFECPFFSVQKDRVQIPNGETVDWFLRKGPHAVMILPQTQQGNFLVEKTYKYGADTEIYEFPSGIIEVGEDPIVAAQRELLEETGFAGDLVFLGETFVNPTDSDMRYFYFLAKNCVQQQKPQLEKEEQIEILELKTIEQVKKLFFKSSQKTACASLSAIFFWEQFFR